MTSAKVYKDIAFVPSNLRRQLCGLGNCATDDSLRKIASGRAVDDGRVPVAISIMQDNGRVLSWGVLYWDDYGCSGRQGIQLYTRQCNRGRGYGKMVYNSLKAKSYDGYPIISVFKDNLGFWKAVGAVPKHVHVSSQRSRPTKH